MLPMLNKVVHLYRKDEQVALERLNRITGLQFNSRSESLVPARNVSEPLPEKVRGEPLLDQVRQG